MFTETYNGIEYICEMVEIAPGVGVKNCSINEQRLGKMVKDALDFKRELRSPPNKPWCSTQVTTEDSEAQKLHEKSLPIKY